MDDSPTQSNAIPTTPISPTLSDSPTCVDEVVRNDRSAPVQAVPQEEQETAQYDPESLELKPTRRSTISDVVKRVGTSFSEKLPSLPEIDIPVHWRRNYLSQGRHPQRIDDHPEGYPRFAAFINSDENFLISRRYGLLHTRMMLYRQAELDQLEQELYDLDKEDEKTRDRALRDVKFLGKGDNGKYRLELIKDIEEKLKSYDEMVLRHREMQSLPKASSRNYGSVDNYLHHNGFMSAGDQAVFKKDADFAALVDPKEAVALDSFIEDVLSMIPCQFTKLLFSTPAQRASTEDKLVHLYSKQRIDTFVRLLITVLAVALLMAPVVVLFEATTDGAVKILVILVFTLFFSVALSIFTKAQRQEVFAATAAYCAVLVVFLGNILPNATGRT